MKTQARSLETQGRLLEATVRCLVERGYQGTSTAEVCRQAGASKGALLHHYPTRAALVSAAVEHLFQLRTAEFRAAMAAGPLELDDVLGRLWEIYSGPTLGAWLELVVASRTDPELRKAVANVDERLSVDAEAIFCELFRIDDPSAARTGARMVMALFDGLALNLVLERDDALATDTIALFRAVVAPWLADRQGGSK